MDGEFPPHWKSFSLLCPLPSSHISFVAQPHIVWPITHIFSPSSPARPKVAMGCWAPALWLTSVECVVGGRAPVERWREVSKMSRFPSVTTRSWTSRQELRSLKSRKCEPARITWVRANRQKKNHAHTHTQFKVSYIILLAAPVKARLRRGNCRLGYEIWPTSVCVLAQTNTVNVVTSQTPSR